MTEHETLRDALGAYTVGALDPAERADVERHLRDCASCRDDLVQLEVLPSMLGRLSADEAEAAVNGPSPVDPVVAPGRFRDELGRLRRALRAWQVAAAVAVGALVLVVLPLPGGGAAMVFEPRPAVPDAADAEGRVEVTARPWGMQVSIDLRDVPARRGYGMWAVDGDEHSAPVASWSATPEGNVRLQGACYMSIDDLARFELKTPDDEILMTFETA